MLVICRFRVPEGNHESFRAELDAAVAVLASRPGHLGADVVRNLDEPDLWALVQRWADVGSYRRALQGFESKMTVVPLLSRAIDEPSAYLTPDEVGTNLPRGSNR